MGARSNVAPAFMLLVLLYNNCFSIILLIALNFQTIL